MRLSDGQGVDDPRPRQRVEVGRQPGCALGGIARLHHRQPQRLAVQAATQHHRVASPHSELRGDVGHDPVVGGGSGGQHGDVGTQFGDQSADAPVIGPKVVSPVRDAVGLVDDDQPGIAGQRR